MKRPPHAMRKRMTAALLVGLALVPSVLVSSGAPQEQPPRPVFRTDVELVQIDVTVVDAEGRPVRGLTRDDFEVFERSTPRTLAVFEGFSHGRRPSSPLPSTTTIDVADNSAARSDRIIVLVLDDLHFQRKTEDVKHMARRIVDSIGAGASMSLVTTSGRFGVEPTDDRALLLNELDRFVDRFDPEGRRAKGAVAPTIRSVRGPVDPRSSTSQLISWTARPGPQDARAPPTRPVGVIPPQPLAAAHGSSTRWISPSGECWRQREHRRARGRVRRAVKKTSM